MIYAKWRIEDFFLQGKGGGDFGHPTRTEGVRAYGRIVCSCELGRGHSGCRQER